MDKKIPIKGKQFKELDIKDMQRVQGSGNKDNNNNSHHTFSAKFFMKGGNINER